LKEIEDAITALDAMEAEATMEQVLEVFAKAVEALQSTNDQATQEMQEKVEAKLIALQAKIEAGAGQKSKKFDASLSLKRLKASSGSNSEFKPYTAGVDVTAWTPEAEIENIETFHPLIGVVGGFEIGTTSKESIKVRKLSKNSGGAAVVLDHAAKPVIELIGAQSVVNVATYAGVVEGIADEDLEDNPTLEAEVQQEALTDLGEVENTAAIALLEAQAVAFANVNFGTKAGADERTAIAAIIDQVRQALGKRTSDICLALNSSQWALLDDLRAQTSGVPLGIESVLGNVIRIVDNSLTTDKFYCWAKKFAKIKMYKPAQADWYKGVKVIGTSGSYTAIYSEWRTDESSLRVRQREAIYVTDVTTIVKGTISGVVTAVTAEVN